MFTKEMVHTALQTWCDNVVKVGKVHTEGGDVQAFSLQVLSDSYDYDNGHVLFKPTLTFGQQTFRPTKVWYSKEDFILNGELAIVQCNVHFIGDDDSHIFVNKSFVFKQCDDGKVRIILHQSSLPYQP